MRILVAFQLLNSNWLLDLLNSYGEPKNFLAPIFMWDYNSVFHTVFQCKYKRLFTWLRLENIFKHWNHSKPEKYLNYYHVFLKMLQPRVSKNKWRGVRYLFLCCNNIVVYKFRECCCCCFFWKKKLNAILKKSFVIDSLP